MTFYVVFNIEVMTFFASDFHTVFNILVVTLYMWCDILHNVGFHIEVVNSFTCVAFYRFFSIQVVALHVGRRMMSISIYRCS